MIIGQILDERYKVLRKLGEGGMGEVYLVEHVVLGRREALKILHPSLASDAHLVSRFRREARATNRVQHPNIVAVYDFGKLPDGRFFLSLEYAEGERLDALIARGGPLPVGRALHVLAQLADAVDHAHGQGVVHRDLKPSNLALVEHRGRPDVLKVFDFGIAKIVAPEYNETHGLTAKGDVFGTPHYMAPEQINGEGSDPRIDLYAIGCIAFEMLVGTPPFGGRTMELMHQHLTKRPDAPSSRRPEARIPRELDELVLKLLEKDATRRVQTGRDLRAALERVPGFGEHKASTDRQRRRTLQNRIIAGPGDFDAEEKTHEGPTPSRMAATPVTPPRAPQKERNSFLDDPWNDDTASGAHVNTPSTAPTEMLQVVGDSRRALVQRTVRELAEALLDAGAGDVQLVLGVARAKELATDLGAHDQAMAGLEQRGEQIEQAARARQAPLRFALGELVFQRQSGVRLQPDAERQLRDQVRELEQRIARIDEELERDMAAILDQSMNQAVARARTEDEVAALERSLERLVDELAPRYGAHPSVVRLHELLRHERARLPGVRGVGR